LPDDEHPLGVARCGMYENRPAACRVFPTKLNENRDLAIIYDVPERGRAGSNPIYQLCARPWEPEDVDPVQGLQDLVVAQYEMSYFHMLADAWNRGAGLWSAFPDFLRMVYGSRVLSKEGRSATRQPAGSESWPVTAAKAA
jgi:hypothetical protein